MGVGSVAGGDGVVAWPVGVVLPVRSGPGVPDADVTGVVALSELSGAVVGGAEAGPGVGPDVVLDCCPVGLAVGLEGPGSGAEVVPPCLDDARVPVVP